MFYLEHYVLTLYFYSDSFRFGRSVNMVEVFSSAEEECGLSKYSKKSIAISTSMKTTAKSEDKKEFKFKIRVKTRVLSVVI